MNLGSRILQLRKEKGITQETLSGELGVTAAAISKWEKDYTMPDVLMLNALADYFHVSTDELLGRKEYLKKVVIAASSRNFARKVEVIARQYGYITVGICETYEEALLIAEDENDISYILLSGKVPNTEIEKMNNKRVKVMESVCDTEEESLYTFELLLRGLEGVK